MQASNLGIATALDIPVLVKMAKKFIGTTPYKDLPQDDKKIEEVILDLINNKKNVLVTYLHNNKIVGMLGGVTHELIINRDTVASEIMWWVEPGFRSRKTLALQEAFEYWAQHKMNAKIIHFSSLNDPKVARFYERRGYTITENSFVKVL